MEDPSLERIFVSPMDKRERNEADDQGTSQMQKRPNRNHSEAALKGWVLVHCTDVFPENGIMIAGELYPHRKEMVVQARWTLHWTLNSVIHPENHTGINGEACKRKYCIIEPFAECQKQFYGGNFQDMMLLGDHSLSTQAIIFVPETELESRKQQTESWQVQVELRCYSDAGKYCLKEAIRERFDGEYVNPFLKPSGTWEAWGESNRLIADVKEWCSGLFEHGNWKWVRHDETIIFKVNAILTRLNAPYLFKNTEAYKTYEWTVESFGRERLKGLHVLLDHFLNELKHECPRNCESEMQSRIQKCRAFMDKEMLCALSKKTIEDTTFVTEFRRWESIETNGLVWERFELSKLTKEELFRTLTDCGAFVKFKEDLEAYKKMRRENIFSPDFRF